MHTSIYAGADSASALELVERVRAARAEGWTSTWVSQGAGLDGITAAAIALASVDDIHVGTAVLPIQGRHPLPLAQQALTLTSAFGAQRFSLGVGVTHPAVSEQWFGVPYRDVVALCEEHVAAMSSLLSADRYADIDGHHLTVRAGISIDGDPPPIVLAALGPRMLALAAGHASGVVTWMTDAAAVRTAILPALESASAALDRAPPRLIVGLPVCVTDDVDGVRGTLTESMSRTGSLPAYRRMLDAAGVQHAVDIAVVGSADSVLDRLGELAALGVSELLVNAVGDGDEVAATRQLLATQSW